MRRLVLILSVLCQTFAVLGCTSHTVESGVNRGDALRSPVVVAQAQCVPQDKVSNVLKMLSTGNPMEVEEAQQFLLNTSKKSDICRGEVVGALMKAMDKPNLNFKSDQDAYHLWRYGAAVLGEMKAAESLDLLISHLDLRLSTFSTSMNHQPALGGVIEMGTIAIPKLDAVLKKNPNPQMRFDAVFCIATIGGVEAVRSLKEALPTESDDCVSRFIRVSLESFDDQGQIRDRGKWFPFGLCNE